MRPACHGHTEQTAAIRKAVDEGKSHDTILASFIQQYGQHVLEVPADSAFNRLAWLVPYLLAGMGLVVIILSARRWSHRPATATGAFAPSTDPALNARLDDELRDLD